MTTLLLYGIVILARTCFIVADNGEESYKTDINLLSTDSVNDQDDNSDYPGGFNYDVFRWRMVSRNRTELNKKLKELGPTPFTVSTSIPVITKKTSYGKVYKIVGGVFFLITSGGLYSWTKKKQGVTHSPEQSVPGSSSNLNTTDSQTVSYPLTQVSSSSDAYNNVPVQMNSAYLTPLSPSGPTLHNPDLNMIEKPTTTQV